MKLFSLFAALLGVVLLAGESDARGCGRGGRCGGGGCYSGGCNTGGCNTGGCYSNTYSNGSYITTTGSYGDASANEWRIVQGTDQIALFQNGVQVGNFHQGGYWTPKTPQGWGQTVRIDAPSTTTGAPK